ncbi:MAG: D-3-phosphoglycerate dehydrogenase (EC [uncultured Campylobacterales bacterium]|uniref:D-3-phosphoglycerate dehydrogenase (EC) n=1 Tax=uncultured Campylobacterales bacterium TaxID=352960 RepID=A0A6S6SQC2_9BACT|nr:MAG: D-3-phosphoglycerate dehydrogenase (EC [uncultured Campylobacterales bacterium]
MNDGVVLINVSHGGLYNEDALYEGLKSGKIGFLGIDTFLNEPATADKLLEFDNVTATPHIKSATKEVQINISKQSTKQAVLAARNISYLNPVNLPLDTTSLPSFVKPFIELTQKISSLGIQANSGSLRAVQLSAEGEISEYLNFLMPLALTGVMKQSLGDQVNYQNAEEIANENAITFDYTSKANSSAYKNKLTVTITTTNATTKVDGTIFADNIARIVSINDIMLDIIPSGKMLIFQNSDVPGVIADISKTLSSNNINIADFRLGRDGKGNALAVVIVDQRISKSLLATINDLDTCIWAQFVEI